MKFALVTLGSTGDLYPFLAIGRALREQGHEVFLLSQAPYLTDASRAGLKFIPVVDATAHQRTLAHPKLWHPIEGLGVLWRHLCLPAARPTWEALQQLCVDLGPAEPLRVLASPLAVGARLARDTAPILHWTAYLSPAGLRSLDNPMFLGPWQLPSWLPQPLRRLAWHALDHWKLEPMARAVLSKLAAEVAAAAPTGSIFGDWVHGLDGGLALYDTAFASIPRRMEGALDQSHRRALLHQVGFPNFEWEPCPGNAAALEESPKSWLIFGGSAGTHDSEQAERLARALTTLSGRPCLLLERGVSAEAVTGASGVTRLPLQPLPPLLRQTHAFIHHAGVGSCAQGLAAGVPQILIPRAYDQFENAFSLQRMGAGRTMPRAIVQSSSARQAEWILGATCALREAPAERTYSIPGSPNGAVQLAIHHLTAA